MGERAQVLFHPRNNPESKRGRKPKSQTKKRSYQSLGNKSRLHRSKETVRQGQIMAGLNQAK